MLPPGVMVQNCSLSVRHCSCQLLFEKTQILMDLNYQTILEMRFAVVRISFPIYSKKHIFYIMWQGDSCCMPTIFLVGFKVESSKFLGTARHSMTGHECIWRKIIGTLSSVLTPGVMVQNCSLSVRHCSCQLLFEKTVMDLNYQTILEMRFAVVRISFPIYSKKHIFNIIWQGDSCCMPTMFVVSSFKLLFWFHIPVGSCILESSLKIVRAIYCRIHNHILVSICEAGRPNQCQVGHFRHVFFYIFGKGSYSALQSAKN